MTEKGWKQFKNPADMFSKVSGIKGLSCVLIGLLILLGLCNCMLMEK